MAIIGVTASRHSKAQKYVQAVQRAGGTPRVLSPETTARGDEAMDSLDGLLLTGGPDIDPTRYGEQPGATTEPPDSERDEFELGLVRAAFERDTPILAICRGMQLLNVALGGQVVQEVPGHDVLQGDRSSFHEVFIAPGSRLAVVVGQGHGGFPWVNSRHHQDITQSLLARGLHACAYSPSDAIIEAVESHEHRFALGVQWHPERLEDYQPKGVMHPKFLRLFDALVGEAREYARRRKTCHNVMTGVARLWWGRTGLKSRSAS